MIIILFIFYIISYSPPPVSLIAEDSEDTSGNLDEDDTADNAINDGDDINDTTLWTTASSNNSKDNNDTVNYTMTKASTKLMASAPAKKKAR